MVPINEIKSRNLPHKPGLYVLSENIKRTRNLYVGETLNLQSRFTRERLRAWSGVSDSIFVQTLPMDHSAAGNLAWQSCLVKKFKPRLNCFQLSRPGP